MKSPPLQPLRIPAGWMIEYNDLREVDASPQSIGDWLREDLLQLKQRKTNILIDAGWYGDADTGEFAVYVEDHNSSGGRLHEFRSPDRLSVVAEIERLLAQDWSAPNIGLVLANGEGKLTGDDWFEIERKLGFPLPSDMKTLYLSSNGGEPSPNVWVDPLKKWEPIEIRDFFPFLYKADQNNDAHFTADGIAVMGWKRNTLPQGFLPFAIDWGGNYLCVNLNDGTIFYVTRDTWDESLSPQDNFKKGARKIAGSFSDFMKNINECAE